MKRILSILLLLCLFLTGCATPAAEVQVTEDTPEPQLILAAEKSSVFDAENAVGVQDKEQENPVAIESINEIEGVKENIFNNLLNSIDYYDAVQGEFTTTLYTSTEGITTTISYVSDIPAQKSYQKISENRETAVTEVYVVDGNEYTINNLEKSYTVQNIGTQDVAVERVKKNTNICVPASVSLPTDSIYAADRVSVAADGMPIYRYRNDLTNAHYAAESIFPQYLTFGLLSNLDDWNVIGTGTYLDRCVVIVQGIISDPVYSEKINSASFSLAIDYETGIILEFIGYDADGNETESIRTTEINIIKDDSICQSNLAGFVDNAMERYRDYSKKEIACGKSNRS